MEEIYKSDDYAIYKEIADSIDIFYREYLEDEEAIPLEIYRIDGDKIIYILGGNYIKEIVLIGFESLPTNILSPHGFGFKEKSINNFFKYRLTDVNYNKIIILNGFIDEDSDSEAMYFDISDLEDLKSNINQEQRACDDTKRTLVKNFVVDSYPELPFSYQETNNNKQLILRNLNSKLIEKLTADDIEKIGDFYIEASKKYSRPDIVKRMVKGLQKNAQVLTLQEIINKYEQLLRDNPSESHWQSFFNEYITLFDNRYYKRIDHKNIGLGKTNYPDLVLVDIYGYIDFYELKKSDMELLRYDKDHDTFYWSTEVSKVIAQATNYLQIIKDNSINYASAIKKQTETENNKGIDINIISPRAIIVAGSSNELNTQIKKNHFKNLRESLKNIEFVLYDELLDRLKNLLEQIKL